MACSTPGSEDEKLRLPEFRSRGHEVTKIDGRDLQLGLDEPPTAFNGVDIAFNRALESSPVRYIARFADHYDSPVARSANGTDPHRQGSREPRPAGGGIPVAANGSLVQRPDRPRIQPTVRLSPRSQTRNGS